MSEKDNILKAIESLKVEKPDGWKRHVRRLLNRLAYLDDPYAEHEDHGTEQRGRHIHRTDGCPLHDEMGDNAWP